MNDYAEQGVTQLQLLQIPQPTAVESPRRFRPALSVSINRKGVLDIDTVKGCRYGMGRYPDGGCYGLCYANKLASLYGYDFTKSVSRHVYQCDRQCIADVVGGHPASWFRIGTMGDPCHDWELTASVCNWLGYLKIPVVVTKHWRPIPHHLLPELHRCGAIVNTSVSPLDSDVELRHRIVQDERLREAGIESVLRIVSARFGDTLWGVERRERQRWLMSLGKYIDNPLRIPATDQRVLDGHIIVERHTDLGGGSTVSIHSKRAYLGTCSHCPDQCGVNMGSSTKRESMQEELFVPEVEFETLPTVIGSGYEKAVAELAIEDGIAKRAARKNMQIHSAVILKIDGAFAGFFTFEKNHESREFCLLQSVIRSDLYTDDLYRRMVEEVIAENTDGYPAVITTDPKSKFETPKLFESLGFVTYLKMSNFHYMVRGPVEAVRHKLLAHITMTNVWNSVKGDWLRLKREWNGQIEEAGSAAGVLNPTFASRAGCWQGEAGFSNVVNTKRTLNDAGEVVATTKSHNGNASVLDPVACEIILRFFMPTKGRRVYNPFGGGVQFGFIAGSYGYEYVASEIRQNQCDANNKLCAAFSGVRWVKSDSAAYEPDGMFDLIFTCPPYYKVETYLDYDGQPPSGEINSVGTYEEFLNLLWAGYERGLAHLRENCFFVVMTGDSRDKDGAYHCHEAETELFLKEHGLSVYNKIVYLESEFTRLAQAKRTLNFRKFPKREQKIIVAYKGRMDAIRNEFVPVGRL